MRYMMGVFIRSHTARLVCIIYVQKRALQDSLGTPGHLTLCVY